MTDSEWLASRFEEQRPRLRGVAYRLLGSLSDADDAVQDAWLRLSGSDSGAIDNLGGWLTTVVARVCLNMLRSRSNRRESTLDDSLPDPIVIRDGRRMPDEEAILADSVSLALLVVLGTLSPTERLSFVLHDMFDFPYGEIAPLVGGTPASARQLASRARRRVRGAELPPPVETDRIRQREAVDAFFLAAREGDFNGLVAILHPDAVLRSDFGGRRLDTDRLVRGAASIAGQALRFALPDAELAPVLVSGNAGVLVLVGGWPTAIMGFTVRDGLVIEIDAIADPERVQRIAAAAR
ncbi:MAG TPA: sigma-70 family RNA polymerase sigma factor [Galbitalea sp.]|nr:sigma-70 family RNA polymerase sigma factor [Galbitalea sp.]